MENMRDDTESSQHRAPGAVKKSESVSFDSKDKNLKNKEQIGKEKYDTTSWISASQILWSTGTLSEPIPNGFYSVAPDKKLKELYNDLPTINDLHDLEANGLKVDVIFVDAEKDTKLSMLKQYTVAAVKGLTANPATMIKKIAAFVCDVYKLQNLKLSPKKAATEASLHLSDSGGVQLLGKIKHGSCRTRAILFKVLADAVGLECRLLVGLPMEHCSGCADSYKHMSVLVVLNSVELLVDLIRVPGQLLSQSSKALFMTAAGESDSFDSPIEPNSPLYRVSERVEAQRSEKDGPLQRRREASSNIPGPSLNNKLLRSNSVDRKISLSQGEPKIADSFGRTKRKVIASKGTASSRPEDASSSSHMHRLRRSMSMTPEISDEIVRSVRAMNVSMKQNRLPKEHEVSGSESFGSNAKHNIGHTNNAFGIQLDKVSGETSSSYTILGQHKAESLHSSSQGVSEEVVLTWNRVMHLPIFQDKPLLPFEEWNIDFSELTVGTRVGIGFFGEVFRGVWNGTEVAIKVFLEQDLTAENMEDFCHEVSILSRLRHPNVILFLGACVKPPRLSMITEYMDMGSLFYLIHLSGQKNMLNLRLRVKMLCDICRGLMYIHRMKIIHRDLKSANCLVSKHWTVKICDFGLSKFMTNAPITSSSAAGTPEWVAPEVIRSEPFTEKCDIYSLGVIIWELYTLNKPWDGRPLDLVVNAVANEGLRLEIPTGPVGRLIAGIVGVGRFMQFAYVELETPLNFLDADCFAEPQARPNCEEILTRLLDSDLLLE